MICVWLSVFVEMIDSRPGICMNWVSSGAATVEAMISGADQATRAKAAVELGQHDVGLLIQHKVFDALKVAIVDKAPEHREGAMLG